MQRYMRPVTAVCGAIAATLFAACGAVIANPSAPVVVGGQAAFSTSGGLLTVANSPGAIINWQAFSIGRDETTRFLQQSATSTVLNRVVGINPSEILGRLSSNGIVFLINPNGIAFGTGATIDVAGLVASSLALSDADFAAGRLRFAGNGREGPVTNAGEIRTAAGGLVALSGPQVINSGLIRAPSGDIALAAGSTVQFVDLRHPYIQIELSAPDDAALPLARLGSASGAYGYLVRQSGVISTAGDNQLAGGRVALRSAQALKVDAASLTDASGRTGGQVDLGAAAELSVDGSVEAAGRAGTGGTVRAGAAVISLSGTARIDVSGSEGGGIVLVGTNPDLPPTESISMAPGAGIQASALDSGTGGIVSLSATRNARFLGNIEARGGPRAGDGGQVEISAGSDFVIHGTVDTRAPAGTDGQLLVDPSRIDIVPGSTGLPGALADGLWTSAEDPGTQALGAADLGALLLTTSVTLQATQTISLAPDASISVAPSAARTITLSAPNIELQGKISASGAPLNVSIDAAGGTVQIGDQAALALAGGKLAIAARTLSSGETRAIENRERQTIDRSITDTPALRAEVEAEITRDNARLAATLRACSRNSDIRQGCAVSAPRRFHFAGV